jgi:hypothetical protein
MEQVLVVADMILSFGVYSPALVRVFARQAKEIFIDLTILAPELLPESVARSFFS